MTVNKKITPFAGIRLQPIISPPRIEYLNKEQVLGEFEEPSYPLVKLYKEHNLKMSKATYIRFG